MPQISISSLLGNQGPNYPEAIARPYREQLSGAGFEAMLTESQVDQALDRQDDQVVLVVVNSVCGCAARVARPAAILSMAAAKVPDRRYSVFAGMEKEAVSRFREKYLPGITPSSPNIALFRNGKLLHLIQRHQIEGRTAGEIAAELVSEYIQRCRAVLPAEEREKIKNFFEESFEPDSRNLDNE